MKYIVMTPAELKVAFETKNQIVFFAARKSAPIDAFPNTPRNGRQGQYLGKAPLTRGMVFSVNVEAGTFNGQDDHGHGGNIKVEHCVFQVDQL